jgi:hypothetical protein
VLSDHLAKFQYCYEKALLSHPNLVGTITVRWTIDGNGTPSQAQVIKSQMNYGPLDSCIIGELLKLRFPPSIGGNSVIKFPFSFASSSL